MRAHLVEAKVMDHSANTSIHPSIQHQRHGWDGMGYTLGAGLATAVHCFKDYDHGWLGLGNGRISLDSGRVSVLVISDWMFWSTKPNERWTEPSTFLTLKTLKHACVKYFLLLVPLWTVKQFSVWWLWTDIALIIIPCSCRLSTEMCWQPEMLNIVGFRNN